jgi:hypothetical protein
MKRSWGLAALGAIIVIIALILSGCGNSVMAPTNTLKSQTLRVEDGREIQCVVYVGYSVSCDWERPLSDIGSAVEGTQ